MTVILWALDRVRGRALGWLGPGSPKSQPHQALRGVAKLATGLVYIWPQNRQDVASGTVTHDFATAMTTVRRGEHKRRTYIRGSCGHGQQHAMIARSSRLPRGS